MFDAVDGVNTFEDIFDRIVHRIFPGLQRQTFVTEILERDHFLTDFFLRQFLSCDMLVL